MKDFMCNSCFAFGTSRRVGNFTSTRWSGLLGISSIGISGTFLASILGSTDLWQFVSALQLIVGVHRHNETEIYEKVEDWEKSTSDAEKWVPENYSVDFSETWQGYPLYNTENSEIVLGGSRGRVSEKTQNF